MMIKLLYLGLVLYLVLFTIGCAGIIASVEKNKNNQSFNNKAIVQKVMHLDPQFSGIELRELKTALTKWEASTNGKIKWFYDDWPAPTGTLFLPRHPAEPAGSCLKHVLVIRSLSTDRNIVDTEVALKYGIRGYAQNSTEECGTEIIYLVVDKIHHPIELHAVMLHEIGHNVGLEHNSLHSIMNTKMLDKILTLTKIDIENFRKVWNCD